MGRAFADFASTGATFSPARAEQTVRQMLTVGVVLVEETGGKIEGAVMGAVVPIWYAEEAIAMEMALWVQPDSRGGRVARGLVAAFEAWAQEAGARFVSMSDLKVGGEFSAGRIFERQGYALGERSWIKGV